VARTRRSAESRCARHSRQAMAIEPIPAEQDTARSESVRRTTRSVDSEQQSGGSKAEALLSRNAYTENLRQVAVLSYVVGSASSAQRRHDLSAAGGRLVINTRASLMEHTKALGWCHQCRAARFVPPAMRRTMYTCSGSSAVAVRVGRVRVGSAGRQSAGARSVGARSMLNTSVSESARPSFPGDARRRRLEGGRGFPVVDSAKPRHLWGSDERIFSVSCEGSATSSEVLSSSESLGFFYFLGQA
jgi:hypothetical protein